MSLALLVPAFLAGLLAIAVPILVHLRHRERKDPIRFPSLMFLARVPYRSVHRRRVTHPLLLLLRALALGLLVLAFARPFFKRSPDRPIGASARRAVIVVLDRSMSMGYQGVWARARDSVTAALSTLRPGDQAALVAFDDASEVIAPLDQDVARLRTRLGGLTPGGRGTRLAAGLRTAREIAAAAKGLAPEIVLVSDLQRTGTQGLEAIDGLGGAPLRVVSVASERPVNARVVAVEVDRTLEGKRARLAVGARVAAKGGDPHLVRATLTVNGRKLADAPIRLAPNATPTVRFEPVWVSEGDAIASVELEPDLLPADDTLRFALGAATGLRVALLLPPGARAEETIYLERALGISGSPRLTVDARRGLALPEADLSRVAAAVVADGGALSAQGLAGLMAFVRRGGGLLVFSGARAGSGFERVGGWPARVGRIIDRSADRGGTLGYLNRDHAALEPFKDALTSDFGAARFFRYRELTPDSTAETVARFDDGRPAVVESRLGAGRVVLVASPTDGLWNDLPLQPVFLPLVHRLVGYVSRTTEEKRSYSVGDVVTLSGHAEATLNLPGGGTSVLPADTGARLVAFTTPGYYRIDASDLRTGQFAVNPPEAESDLSALSPAELAIMMRTPSDSTRRTDPIAALSSAEQERTQSGWIYLLAAALALLGIEALYAGRLTSRVRVPGGVT